MDSHPPAPDLDQLVALFYADPSRLGEFEKVEASQMTAPYDLLLAHENHMTVTVESFHGNRVDVEVLETSIELPHYARKILLRRQDSGEVVQFGIMRLNLNFLAPDVQQEIIGQRTPLGRVLIEHNVLRNVELVGLWRVSCGEDLAQYFGVKVGTTAYGRTALIHCNGEPAVELLEIVTP